VREFDAFGREGRVSDEISPNPPKGNESVNLDALAADNMRCADPAHSERIGNERTVASPGHRFRAHDRGLFLLRQFDQSLQALLEFRRLHIIGEPAKGSVTPAHIRRISPRVPQASQPAEMHIADPGAAQLRGERLAIELRVVPRFGNAAHVHDAFDSVRTQQFEELFPSARGVPNGENGEHSQLWLCASRQRRQFLPPRMIGLAGFTWKTLRGCGHDYFS